MTDTAIVPTILPTAMTPEQVDRWLAALEDHAAALHRMGAAQEVANNVALVRGVADDEHRAIIAAEVTVQTATGKAALENQTENNAAWVENATSIQVHAARQSVALENTANILEELLVQFRANSR